MRWLWFVMIFGLVSGVVFAVVSRLLKSKLGKLLFVLGTVLVAGAMASDLISGFLGYRSFYTDIRDTGAIGNPNAMKIIAAAMALACYYIVGEMMRKIYQGKMRQFVLLLVGGLAIYWSVMLFFSGEQLFGPEGPLYKYSESPSGRITLRDRNLSLDPETGQGLKLLTPEIAEKYRQQKWQDTKSKQEEAAKAESAALPKPSPGQVVKPQQTVQLFLFLFLGLVLMALSLLLFIQGREIRKIMAEAERSRIWMASLGNQADGVQKIYLLLEQRAKILAQRILEVETWVQKGFPSELKRGLEDSKRALESRAKYQEDLMRDLTQRLHRVEEWVKEKDHPKFTFDSPVRK